MEVVGAGEQGFGGGVDRDQTGSAVRDVEDEGAAAVGGVTDEGAAGGEAGMDGDGRHVDAVAAQAVEIELAEIVGADAGDHPAGLAEPGDLADEDGGRSGGERSGPQSRLQEGLADLASP